MALILQVPYEEKDEAKALGAKWNPQLRKWYVESRRDYHKFINGFLAVMSKFIFCVIILYRRRNS